MNNLSKFLAPSALLIALATSALSPSVSYADFGRVCRGGSLYKYDNELRKAVQAKLTASNVAFKRVNVQYSRIVRPHDSYVNDFASDITVGSGATPSVTFSGAFPDLATCTLTFNVKITVVYPDGSKAITIKQTTAPGSLLPPLGRKREASDE